MVYSGSGSGVAAGSCDYGGGHSGSMKRRTKHRGEED
jgi:hypothetical protein